MTFFRGIFETFVLLANIVKAATGETSLIVYYS